MPKGVGVRVPSPALIELMTNDETRMTNEIRMTKSEIRHSDFVIDSSFWFRISSLIICLMISSSLALADSVFVGSLERKDATIKLLKSDTLVFEINDKVSEIPISKISRIIVSSDPPLSAAEESYARGNLDSAVDDYQKAIRTTSKQWVKDWSAMRLIEAASKTGRFDAAATAYILTLLRIPNLPPRLNRQCRMQIQRFSIQRCRP